ncbi:MAG: hypothetical protein U1A27_03290 [Phycisphaerae bacterium]
MRIVGSWRVSVSLNLLLPGSGLILARRERAGVALALLFGSAGQVAVAGWGLAPQTLGATWTWIATIVAGGAWLLAQALLWTTRSAAAAPTLTGRAGPID